MGDTIDYVDSIVARIEGRNYYFWEFAHLLWRPLGFLFSFLSTPLTRFVVGDNIYANLSFQLIILSWFAGLAGVVLTYSLVILLFKKELVANVVAVAFVFSQAVLNYAQTGSSYVPGLSLLTLGLYIVARGGAKSSVRTAMLAALALAGSVFLWVTYVLALPAALLSPLFFFGFEKRRLRLVILTSIACFLIIGFVYGLVLINLKIHNLTQLRAWMSASADAAFLPRGGVFRTIFSLARSFISMGNEGVIFKRFLLQDPFNPVSLFDLVRISLWKLAAFYLFIGSIVINALRTKPGVRLIGLLLIGSAPVLTLALLLEAGAVDRYMPLYPFVFLTFACALSSAKSVRGLNFIAIGFAAATIVTNVQALANPVLNRQQEAAVARIRELQPRLKPGTLLFTINLRDELVNFNRTFLFNPINLDSDHRFQVASIITPGARELANWRQEFSTRALMVWEKGADVWISKRVLSPTPKANWDWVEGDDPRVSWIDVYKFFSQVEMGESLGDADGFFLMVPSTRNFELLKGWKMKVAERNDAY